MADDDKRRRFETRSGIPFKAVYEPRTIRGLTQDEAPGEYPFTRGIPPRDVP